MSTGKEQLYYVLRPESAFALEPSDLPEGYRATLWRPGPFALQPPSMEPYPYALWSLISNLGLFERSGYAVYQVWRDGSLAHASCILPKFYRFPFMGEQDLMVGSTHTDPAHRGRGLAKTALRQIVRTHRAPGVRFWYFADASNRASLRVVEAVGFESAGSGFRTSRLGVKVLGQYVLTTEPLPAPTEVDDDGAEG